MKFSVLSGAYLNAGDFLIVDRSIKLLKNVYPECEIKTYERRLSLEENLEEINKSDALIFAGGPAYMTNIYPQNIPLVDDLNKIKVKMFTMGLGWYGANVSNKYIYNDYKFNETTVKLLERLSKDGKNLSCRDWYSTRVLKANGFENSLMTGCPAWYDLNYINSAEIRDGVNIPFKKICISDPAKLQNAGNAIELVKYLMNKFKDAEIIFVFHRRDSKKVESSAKIESVYDKIKQELDKLKVKVVDISSSADAFSVYDNCDLHIGFRVHAHIYNLSHRNISILIEEDGRGAGVNQALGFNSIKAYKEKGELNSNILTKANNFLGRGKPDINDYLLQNIDDQFNMLFNSNFIQYKAAFFNMQIYFEQMKQHIESLTKI